MVEIVAPSVLIAQQTNAELVFEAAPRETVRVLNYPIAHHRELSRLMGEECERWPRWLDMAQGSSTSEETLCRLDREIDLADKVIVASSFSRRSFQKAGVEDGKIICIPLGVDAAQFNQKHREIEVTRNLSERGPVFNLLFVGQVNQRKGFIDLLDAMSRVESRKLRLTVVGVASSTAREVANFYGQDVHFVGPLPKAALGDYYRNADLFVLPSVVEGFGLSALEAMVAGTPVLVSDHTFGTDIIESGVNGLVVKSRDPEELAKVLTMAIESSTAALNELGARGAEIARTYTWAAYRRKVFISLSGMVNEK